jgi:hypothetical protein
MALLMILCKAGALRWLTSRLAAIGQTALSNYVFQSVVCTLVFTGYGFGLYGRLERYQLYYVVAGCWAMSLAGSPIWLKHYRFGPPRVVLALADILEEAADADPAAVRRANAGGSSRLIPHFRRLLRSMQ